MNIYFKVPLLLIVIQLVSSLESESDIKYKIEGRVVRPETSAIRESEWFGQTQVVTNTGNIGFLKKDGSFIINNIPWGSYIVYVVNPTYVFEMARVDINSKGKIRARVVNNMQPSKVDNMPYPLRLKSLGTMKYFHEREKWSFLDLLYNPMVLMTIFPFLIMLLMPKLSDPEARKEMEQMQMPKVEAPELAELITKYFGGAPNAAAQAKQKAKVIKRKEK